MKSRENWRIFYYITLVSLLYADISTSVDLLVKLRNVALQRDAFLREKYRADVSVYSPDMFIFIDETGTDRRNRLRKYGYSVRGKAAVSHSLLV